jgi:uncharacterized membrane protein
MAAVKKFLLFLFGGALLGIGLFAWISPKILSWYFSPPVDLALSCAPAVEWAIETYRKVMFTGLFLGVLVGGILFFALASRRSVVPGAQNVPPN